MTALKDIGALRRRLTLEEPVETSDGAGGVTRGYVAVATLWAEVTPVSARADITADSSGAVVRLREHRRPRAHTVSHLPPTSAREERRQQAPR